MTQGALDGFGDLKFDADAVKAERMGAVERAVWGHPAHHEWVRGDDGWAGEGDLLPTLIGIDEAGRGPLAGPVSVAAVVFGPQLLTHPPDWLCTLDDSKQLDEATRAALFPKIRAASEAWAIAHVHASHIDEVNILQATFHGMAICVEAVLGLAHQRIHRGPMVIGRCDAAAPSWYGDVLGEGRLEGAHLCSSARVGTNSLRACHALVDGNKRFKAPGSPSSDIQQHPIIKGDTLSYHIAAASVLAKVSRDAVMEGLHAHFPLYGFDRHKGYPTVAHRTAVKAYGFCQHHRTTFRIS